MFMRDLNQFLKITRLSFKKEWLFQMSQVTMKKNKFGIRIENLIYVKKKKNIKLFEKFDDGAN